MKERVYLRNKRLSELWGKLIAFKREEEREERYFKIIQALCDYIDDPDHTDGEDVKRIINESKLLNARID